MAASEPGAAVNGVPSVNGTHEDLELERARLEAELAAARTRIAVSKQRLASREAEVELAMRRELAATREAIAEMEREHEQALAAIRDGVGSATSSGGAG